MQINRTLGLRRTVSLLPASTLNKGVPVAPSGYGFLKNNAGGYALNAQGGRILVKVANG